MWNGRLKEAQPGIKIAGRNINSLRYADDATLMEESEEELKSFLMKVKEESEKAGLKLNIQKTKIMASNPITSWQTDGEKTGTVTDFIFLGSKITMDSDCSHEIKRCLLLGRKVMTNLDSILKSRDIISANKDPSSQNYHFSSSHVWMWELDSKESWVPKNWCFWMWCSRKLLRVPWTARRSNQSILKEINPEYSLEGLILKLKIQYFGHLMWRTNSLEKILMLGKIKGKRRRGWQRMRWLDSIIDSIDMNLSKLQELVKDREDWHAAVHELTNNSNWTMNDWKLRFHIPHGEANKKKEEEKGGIRLTTRQSWGIKWMKGTWLDGWIHVSHWHQKIQEENKVEKFVNHLGTATLYAVGRVWKETWSWRSEIRCLQ